MGDTTSEDDGTATSVGWRLILDELRPRRRWVALGVCVGLAWSSAKISIGLIVRAAIDRGIEAGDRDALVRWALLIAAVGVASGILTGTRRYLAFLEARTVERRLRDRLFAHIQRLHFAYHDRVQTGQLMSRANTDLQRIQALVVMIPLTIANAMTVTGVTIILVLIDPLLALMALASLPIINVVARRFGSSLFPSVMEVQAKSADLAAVVEEAVAGVRVIKGFGAQDEQRHRLRDEADDLYDASMEAATVRARFLPVLDLLPNAGLIAVLGIGGHMVLDDSLSLGSLVAFNVYVVLLIWPMRMLGMIIANAQRAFAAGARVAEVLATDPEIVDSPRAKPLPPGPGDLRFEHVEFGYSHGDVPVLHDLDLEVSAGTSVALVGATGCGKSTVGRLLPRFYDVDGGRITIDGADVREVRVTELRRAVGIVFEETFLFSGTIAENIAFAEPEAPFADIERAAQLAGAHEFIDALDDGYDAVIGERGYSLSGGQRQRIAIARAILADPRVLILDDATSSVDPTKEHEIRDALGEVMAGRTTIVIAHRAATIALADRVVLLDDGRIVADGTHDELLATSEAYRRVLAATDASGGVHAGGGAS